MEKIIRKEIVELYGKYWVDSKGNRWSTSKYTKERAILHSKSLVNCVNCTVKGLELATEEIPFLEGDVLAYDRETFACDIRLKPGTLRPDDPKWHPVGFEKQFGVESFGVEFDKSGKIADMIHVLERALAGKLVVLAQEGRQLERFEVAGKQEFGSIAAHASSSSRSSRPI